MVLQPAGGLCDAVLPGSLVKAYLGTQLCGLPLLLYLGQQVAAGLCQPADSGSSSSQWCSLMVCLQLSKGADACRRTWNFGPD